jgi:nucleoid-associated protein YgaU
MLILEFYNMQEDQTQKSQKWVLLSIKMAIWFVTFLYLASPFCLVVESSENLSEQDKFANIDSGFFVSRNDVYGLQDQAFKEKLLLFLTEYGILTKSSRGLIYYYISEDAIAQLEDLRFRGRVSVFVTDPEERNVHIVKHGDSLWDIATKYGISVNELARLNNMTSADPIYPGQRLRVAPEGE